MGRTSICEPGRKASMPNTSTSLHSLELLTVLHATTDVVDDLTQGGTHGNLNQTHIINPFECIRCGMCKSNCRFDAISVY